MPRSDSAANIVVVRGTRVILDSDLARLYGVAPKRFNEQVRRNLARFPGDFMFRLSNQEVAILRSQDATSSWGGRRYAPMAFTEHGAVMASTIFNSSTAIAATVFVVRAFVQMRNGLAANQEVARRLDQLERKVGTHDQAMVEILGALRELTRPKDDPKRRRIGFVQD